MSKKLSFLILLISILSFITSCDRPECINNNEIFNQYIPSSIEYKRELSNQILNTDTNTLRYWFVKYEKIDNNEFLHFNIQNKDICAVLVLKINDWNKLEKHKASKGLSYSGAEFKDLKYDIIQDSTNIEFVYKSHGRIVD